MRTISTLFLAFLCLIPAISFAEEILSKKDAKNTFNLSFSEWKKNLEQLTHTDVAKSIDKSKYELTMIVNKPKWTLKVTPVYKPNNLSRPYRIAMSVQYPRTDIELIELSDSVLISMIRKWYTEMLPEYSVMTNIDLQSGVAQVNFMLFEAERYPDMDKVAATTKGCWQDCIKR